MFLIFVCWGQHWIKLGISWEPVKKRGLLREKKSQTKEKYNCRVKCTVLIQKPTYTGDQDRWGQKYVAFLIYLNLSLSCSSPAVLPSRFFEELLLCFHFRIKGYILCFNAICVWLTNTEYLLSAGYYFESFTCHLILITILWAGYCYYPRFSGEKTEAQRG